MTKVEPPDDTSEVVEPRQDEWQTHTFRLPFTLGLGYAGQDEHNIALRSPFDDLTPRLSVWADRGAEAVHGPFPTVRMKFVAVPTRGAPALPAHLDEAVQALYDVDIRPPSGEWPLFVERSSETYEQWVTIETPAARLRWEDPSDAGYAFHRSLAALNHFLVAFSTAYNLPGVHEVSTREIGMVMLVGALEPNAQWRVVRYVWMHPDGWEAPQPMKSLAEVEARMGLALTVVGSRPPYLPMKMWHNRAVRAAKDGDSATQVMVLQIAAESMVFATYLMTLVDGHKTGEQVQQEADRFRTFESLVNTQMPRRLGGDWDKRQTETPFGQYWRDVYTMRNKVVHQGYVPHAGEGEAAEAGFRALSRHIRDRLMENQRKYPRTILARLEDPTFYGYTMTRWLESKLSEIREEPAHLFWLPDDVAGRD